jgi:nicotinate phosphoribosyltransferase
VNGKMSGWDERFIYATFDEVRSGLTTDVYFSRTRKVLEKYGLLDTVVHMEVTTSKLPNDYEWGVYAGLREVLKLLEGRKLTVRSLPEGTIFHAKDFYGYKVPVLTVEGPYGEFLELETPLLGFLASASGIATKAARVKKAAGEKLVLSFGARRQHPALAPFIEYYAYVGGADAVSAILGAEALGIRATGTMPHSLLIIFRGVYGDHTLAWKAYDEVIEKDVNRVALVDTFYDETEEALMAAKLLGPKLWGVRLDTPGSRRGNFEEIIREVRWKLDINGYNHVKIVVSGGIDEENIPALARAGADAFGVGAAISTAQPVDFAMDITAMKIKGEWRPIAKRGKLSGRKQVYRCDECLADVVAPSDAQAPRCPKCGKPMRPLLETYIEDGKPVKKVEDPHSVRKYVLEQLKKVEL